MPLNTIPLLKKCGTTVNADRMRLVNADKRELTVTGKRLFSEKFLQISAVLFVMHEESHVTKVF